MQTINRPSHMELAIGDLVFAVENVWRGVVGKPPRKRSGFLVRETYRDSDGSVISRSGWMHNSLMNEGERMILDVFLRNGPAPAFFKVRLFGDTPEETDSLASLTNEPGAPLGYAAQTVLRSANALGWPLLSDFFSGGDFQAESVEVVFRAGGLWPTVTNAVLATSSDNSGYLIDSVQLAQPRQLRSGQELGITYLCRLS